MLQPKLGGRLQSEVWLVVGTRPEAIKLAPVAAALAARGRSPLVILTGQHPGLDPAHFGLGPFTVENLGCPGIANPHQHVRLVAAALLPLLARPPQLVIVQGDTSSALGGALACFTAGIPVAHVEAGLRTHDSSMPWPEEEYRVAIDAQADLLFAPTERSAANLRAEEVPGEIYVTGNTSIDAVLAAAASLPKAESAKDSPSILVTCHRRESWREGLGAIASALNVLGAYDLADINVVLHPNAHVAATMKALLQSAPRVSLIEPCSHLELLSRMRDSTLVLSDSGGIQEEAPALGVPLLVLRNKTERPEGIACGTARLVGTCTDQIVAETMRILTDANIRAAMSRKCLPYGDGKAGPRIGTIIDQWLEGKTPLQNLARW